MRIVETYQDVKSGANAKRPGLDRLMADASAGKFDCVLVWKLDRFGRSLVDCLTSMKILEGQLRVFRRCVCQLWRSILVRRS